MIDVRKLIYLRQLRQNCVDITLIGVKIVLNICLITPRKRSLGQGNMFTPVCHSVHRGGLSGLGVGYLEYLYLYIF